jgi:hypothetical protein
MLITVALAGLVLIIWIFALDEDNFLEIYLTYEDTDGTFKEKLFAKMGLFSREMLQPKFTAYDMLTRSDFEEKPYRKELTLKSLDLCHGLIKTIIVLCGISGGLGALSIFTLEIPGRYRKFIKFVMRLNGAVLTLIAGLCLLTPFLIHNTLFAGTSISTYLGNVMEQWLEAA